MNKKNPKGAGAKLKFGEESVRLSVRVPLSKLEHVRKLFNRHLKKYIKK